MVKLGAISIKSEPRSEALDVHKLYRDGLADDQIIKEIARHSYDKMALQLTEMQVINKILFTRLKNLCSYSIII